MIYRKKWDLLSETKFCCFLKFDDSVDLVCFQLPQCIFFTNGVSHVWHHDIIIMFYVFCKTVLLLLLVKNTHLAKV